jgi:hypothetical protein
MMMSDVFLLNPPLSDFTIPPETLATLKAACGGTSTAIDLNLRAFLDMLSRERLLELSAQCEARISGLAKSRTLGFWEQQELVALVGALADGLRAAEQAGDALDILRGDRFFNRDAYAQVSRTVDSVLRLYSAAAYPFEIGFASIAAPFAVFSKESAARFQAVDPFKPIYDHAVAELHHKKAQTVFVTLMEPSQILPALSLAAAIRAAHPDIHLAVCGALAAQLAQNGDAAVALLHSRFDAIVTHAAEATVPALANKWKAIPGVLFADGTVGKGAVPTHDLETLLVPDYSDLSLSDYPVPAPVLAYRPTRGRATSRAGINWLGLGQKNGDRRKVLPPDLVAAHIAALVTQHQPKLVQFAGDWVSPSWLVEVGEALQARGTHVKFTAELELADDKLEAERLKSAGLVAAVVGVNENAREALWPAIEALAHAGVAVEVDVAVSAPGRFAVNDEHLFGVRSRAQEVDLFQAYEALREPGRRWLLSAGDAGESYFFAGDDAHLHAEVAPPAQLARTVSEAERMQVAYASRRWPLAGAVGSAHTALTFDRFGRRALAYTPRATHAQARSLSDGDRVRLSTAAKMLWIPFQLSIFKEIATEEGELRDYELRRRGRDLGADKVWAYSSRDDLKLRATDRTPHVLAPGMAAQEISFALADALGLVQEQFMPVAQLVSRVAREQRDPLKRQIQGLHQQGALETEVQARREDRAPDNGGGGGGGSNGGGPRPPGQGKRRRRRRGRGPGGGGGGRQEGGSRPGGPRMGPEAV